MLNRSPFDTKLFDDGELWELFLSDNSTIADAIRRSVSLSKADVVSITDTFKKIFGTLLYLYDTISIVDQISKETDKSLVDNVSIADSIFKSVSLNKLDLISIADSLAKDIGLGKADALAIAESMYKLIGAARLDNVSIAESLTRVAEFIRNFSDTITIADYIADTVNYFLFAQDTITIYDSEGKEVTLDKDDILAIADSIVKAIGLDKEDTVTILDSRSNWFSTIKSDVISIADSIGKSIKLFFSAAIAIIDKGFIKRIGKALSDAITIIENSVVALFYSEEISLMLMTKNYMEITLDTRSNLDIVITEQGGG